MNVSFWVDPACPWCWMTARWAVDVVTPVRDLTISWEPISLLFKNDPSEDDESWDETIRIRMQVGLDVVGGELGTPIIAFDTPTGPKGVFGPIMSRMPRGDDGVGLWDAMVKLATHDGFWELKRTRTEDPHLPARP